MKPAESFIGQPIRSLQTMLRVISEFDGTVSTVVPDGIYGKETSAAVTEFQRKAGLPPTGITDQRTWEEIVAVYDDALISIGKAEPIEILWDPNRVYISGDSGPTILLAQSMLLYLSQIHEPIPAPGHNGTLDGDTVRSISAFQEINALPLTGNLDKKTWKYLSRQFTLHTNLRTGEAYRRN